MTHTHRADTFAARLRRALSAFRRELRAQPRRYVVRAKVEITRFSDVSPEGAIALEIPA